MGFFGLGEWFEYNDTKVNIVDASAVESVQAYLLLYIKKEIKLNFNFWLDKQWNCQLKNFNLSFNIFSILTIISLFDVTEYLFKHNLSSILMIE